MLKQNNVNTAATSILKATQETTAVAADFALYRCTSMHGFKLSIEYYMQSEANDSPLNQQPMSAEINCICNFPTLCPFVNGVCDRCGGKFFDHRDLLPIETVTHQTLEGRKTHILATPENLKRMKINEKIAAEKLREPKP